MVFDSQDRISDHNSTQTFDKRILPPWARCGPDAVKRFSIDILEMLDERLQNKEIADKLYISPETAKSHLRNIFQKLNAKNRRQAVEKAKNLGILWVGRWEIEAENKNEERILVRES